MKRRVRERGKGVPQHKVCDCGNKRICVCEEDVEMRVLVICDMSRDIDYG